MPYCRPGNDSEARIVHSMQAHRLLHEPCQLEHVTTVSICIVPHQGRSVSRVESRNLSFVASKRVDLAALTTAKILQSEWIVQERVNQTVGKL